MPPSRPSRRGTARPQSHGCASSTTTSPSVSTLDRRPPSRFGRVVAFSSSRKRSPRMALISTRERPHELGRCRPVRCLCCAHLGDDGRSLARDDRAAAGSQPLRPAAARLASGAVRVRPLHHHSLVLGPHRRAELVMTIAEVTSKHSEPADDRNAAAPPEPKSPAAVVQRRTPVAPFLITLGTVVVAGLLGWAMWRVYVGSPW